MADRHLLEADLARQGGHLLLVVGVSVTVHEGDRDGSEAVVAPSSSAARAASSSSGWSTSPSAAMRSSTSITRAVQHVGQDDVEGEEIGAGLVADPQRIAEASSGHVDRRFARPLQERVGGDGRAHLHRVDQVGRDRFPFAESGAARGSPERRRPRSVAGSPRAACASLCEPSGRRATTSVNVPPRSIQNCQPGRRVTIRRTSGVAPTCG